MLRRTAKEACTDECSEFLETFSFGKNTRIDWTKALYNQISRDFDGKCQKLQPQKIPIPTVDSPPGMDNAIHLSFISQKGRVVVHQSHFLIIGELFHFSHSRTALHLFWSLILNKPYETISPWLRKSSSFYSGHKFREFLCTMRIASNFLKTSSITGFEKNNPMHGKRKASVLLLLFTCTM